MSSRGAVIKNGHVTTEEYETSNMIEDARVLRGKTTQQHGLPDYAHTPNRKYIKENPDGSFREMRDYGADGFPILEIGYHPEPQIAGNRHDKVLHFHTFGKDLSRSRAKKMTKELLDNYSKYLRRYGLYD